MAIPPRVPTGFRRSNVPLARAMAALLLVARFAASDAVTDAADAALRPGADVRALALLDEPDPWLVVDELCARGEFDAAAAYAGAAPRKDVDGLPGYVASRRARRPDAKSRKALASANAALARNRPAEALAAIESATPVDDPLAGIRLAHVRGWALRALDRFAESAEAFLEAGDRARDLGWLQRGAVAFREAGSSRLGGSDLPAAAAAFEEQVRLEERRGNLRGVASALVGVGVVQYRLRDYARALASQERALEAAEAIGDRPAIALILANIGDAQYALRQYSRALASQERSLRLSEELGNRAGVARGLLCVGNTFHALGDNTRALERYEAALRLQKELGDRIGYANTLGNTGGVLHDLGDYPRALACQEEALKRLEELGDRAGVARTLANLGNVCGALGDYARALSHNERARSLFEEIGDPAGVARLHGNIGALFLDLGDYRRALSYEHRALEILEALGDRAGVAKALANIGIAHERGGEYTKALSCQESALRLEEEIGDRLGVARALGHVAMIEGSLGNHERALSCFERSLALREGLGDHAGCASTLLNIGAAHRLLGDHRKALEFYGRARALAGSVGAAETEARSLWCLADVHLALGEPRESVAFAREAVVRLSRLLRGLADGEGAQAREQFADVFSVGAEAARDLGDPGSAAYFLESGRAAGLVESLGARERLAAAVVPGPLAREEREARAGEASAVAALARAWRANDRTEIVSRQRERAEAQARLEEVIARIQREAKGAGALLYGRVDDLATMQARLREGEALVIYGLHSRCSLALVVEPGAARLVRLGTPEAIRAAIESGSSADEAWDSRVDSQRRLLLDPLALSPTTRRLLISPTGVLARVPFVLLAGDREVAYVPSGTSYGLLSEEAGKRGEGVLALGNPTYGKGEDSNEAAVLRGGFDLRPLPASGDEARAVGTTLLLGAAATESGLKRALAERSRWRAVHLACHGLIDPDHPQRSALALAGGDFLTVLDIFRSRIPADLVVASACETAQGRIYRVEGVVGFVRAFLFAGAPRVIVSLWKVDDEATRALMEAFYAHWRTMPAATALKKAQEHVAAQEKWKHPYFWAAWQLWGLPE